MGNVLANDRPKQRLYLKITIVVVVFLLGFYYYWPTLSRLNILSPTERELHGYLKEMLPVVRSTLQTVDKLGKSYNTTQNVSVQKVSVDDLTAEIGTLREKMQVINESYWVIGKRTQTFLRIMMNRLHGGEEHLSSFLPSWKGPDSEPAPLWDMPMNTRTLLVRAWIMKEDSVKLIKALENLPEKLDAIRSSSDANFNNLVGTCWTSLGNVDHVYRRWKGSFRSPIHFSSGKANTSKASL